MKNIFAHTDTTSREYPGYISVNEQDNGTISVSVRTRGAFSGSSIGLTRDQAEMLAFALDQAITAPVAVKPAPTKK